MFGKRKPHLISTVRKNGILSYFDANLSEANSRISAKASADKADVKEAATDIVKANESFSDEHRLLAEIDRLYIGENEESNDDMLR